jgi:hypothetical protein
LRFEVIGAVGKLYDAVAPVGEKGSITSPCADGAILALIACVVEVTGFTPAMGERGAGENLMPQAVRSSDQKLPLSTAILSNVALVLLMWNLALRLALLLGGWARVAL